MWCNGDYWNLHKDLDFELITILWNEQGSLSSSFAITQCSSHCQVFNTHADCCMKPYVFGDMSFEIWTWCLQGYTQAPKVHICDFERTQMTRHSRPAWCLFRVFLQKIPVIYRNHHVHIDRLVQERCNCSALAMKLCLSCTNPTICRFPYDVPQCTYTPWIAT